MPDTDMLTAVAEISVAFAGFGGLIAIFVGRGVGGLSLDDFPQFWFIIELSLLNLFASLVPLVIAQVDPQRLWFWSSLVFVCLLFGYGIRVVRERYGTAADQRLPVAYVALVFGISGAVVLALMVNASGLVSEPQAWPFLVGLYWLLLGIAANYLRFLRILASRV
jgi:hypothetical protein